MLYLKITKRNGVIYIYILKKQNKMVKWWNLPTMSGFIATGKIFALLSITGARCRLIGTTPVPVIRPTMKPSKDVIKSSAQVNQNAFKWVLKKAEKRQKAIHSEDQLIPLKWALLSDFLHRSCSEKPNWYYKSGGSVRDSPLNKLVVGCMVGIQNWVYWALIFCFGSRIRDLFRITRSSVA